MFYSPDTLEIAGVIERLNKTGRQIALKQAGALLGAYSMNPAESAEIVRRLEQKESDIRTRCCWEERKLAQQLQLDGYILVGWRLGEVISLKPTKQGYHNDPGKCAYFPKTGRRWIYVWEFHGQYIGEGSGRRWVYIVEMEKKPRRYKREEMIGLLAAPRPEIKRPLPRQGCWVPTVPYWLLKDGPDRRSLYLAGGKPEEEGE